MVIAFTLNALHTLKTITHISLTPSTLTHARLTPSTLAHTSTSTSTPLTLLFRISQTVRPRTTKEELTFNLNLD